MSPTPLAGERLRPLGHLSGDARINKIGRMHKGFAPLIPSGGFSRRGRRLPRGAMPAVGVRGKIGTPDAPRPRSVPRLALRPGNESGDRLRKIPGFQQRRMALAVHGHRLQVGMAAFHLLQRVGRQEF